ncbi:hypothetical protein KC669_02855 [Candidatus Dojkabacteria bacterium]|uniref:EF-hand domain-containing protein n=1 Tax=Candidatus Dojkabacteria bacterium TaxID=2099670 RepID=A0A955RLD3_9BACT|nr:hypothetical protein [Candidatus Dojkabacteria bacterium]
MSIKNLFTKKILLLWIIISSIALFFGIQDFINSNKPDNSVSVTVGSCYGACKNLFEGEYATGTTCFGDPNVVPGSDKICYQCQSSGNFIKVDNAMCVSSCYAQCLKDTGITEYKDGDKCYNGGYGYPYGVWTCSEGKWFRGEQSQCAGQCEGDSPYTLYPKGHACAVNNVCYQCNNPGSDVLGGFEIVDGSICNVDPSVQSNTPTFKTHLLNFGMWGVAGTKYANEGEFHNYIPELDKDVFNTVHVQAQADPELMNEYFNTARGTNQVDNMEVVLDVLWWFFEANSTNMSNTSRVDASADPIGTITLRKDIKTNIKKDANGNITEYEILEGDETESLVLDQLDLIIKGGAVGSLNYGNNEDVIKYLYFDEPDLKGIDPLQFNAVTTYLNYKYPELRTMVVLGYSFNEDNEPNDNISKFDILRKSEKYLYGVDVVAFDYYYTIAGRLDNGVRVDASFYDFQKKYADFLTIINNTQEIWLVIDGYTAEFSENNTTTKRGTEQDLYNSFRMYYNFAENNGRIKGILSFIYQNNSEIPDQTHAMRDYLKSDSPFYSQRISDAYNEIGRFIISNSKDLKNVINSANQGSSNLRRSTSSSIASSSCSDANFIWNGSFCEYIDESKSICGGIDFDFNELVDLSDFSAFAKTFGKECLQIAVPVDDACGLLDSDSSGAVDLADFGYFAKIFENQCN